VSFGIKRHVNAIHPVFRDDRVNDTATHNHTNVQILGCTFKDSVQSPIMMLNWKNAVIKGNTIDTVGEKR